MTDVEERIIVAVKVYAQEWYSDIPLCDLVGFANDDLARLKTNADGYVICTIENVQITETVEDEDENETIWYTTADCWFEVEKGERVEKGTDSYECYKYWDDAYDVEMIKDWNWMRDGYKRNVQ